ncbi:hypothetical protein E3Q15_03853 [Wallemia mellicola]|nr:hypothetical protein E3Q15_03853 [Wallemia mellicola]
MKKVNSLNPIKHFDEIFKRDKQSDRYIARLPRFISHFLGYRSHEGQQLLPFLKYISKDTEINILGWIGSFVGIALLIAVFSYSNDLVNWNPYIVPSMGASAVLVFGTFESPFAQPRNLIFGHFISALIGVIFQRLFSLNSGYNPSESAIHGAMEVGQLAWFAASLATASAVAAMHFTGTTHPPAGATALIATTMPSIVSYSWRYLATLLISSTLMLGWALIWNNLSSRRYPIYWITPDRS